MNKRLTLIIGAIVVCMVVASGKVLVVDKDVDEEFQKDAYEYCWNHSGLKKAIRVLSSYKALCNEKTTFKREGIWAFLFGSEGKVNEGFEVTIDDYENNFIKDKIEKILVGGMCIIFPLFLLSLYKNKENKK